MFGVNDVAKTHEPLPSRIPNFPAFQGRNGRHRRFVGIRQPEQRVAAGQITDGQQPLVAAVDLVRRVGEVIVRAGATIGAKGLIFFLIQRRHCDTVLPFQEIAIRCPLAWFHPVALPVRAFPAKQFPSAPLVAFPPLRRDGATRSPGNHRDRVRCERLTNVLRPAFGAMIFARGLGSIVFSIRSPLMFVLWFGNRTTKISAKNSAQQSKQVRPGLELLERRDVPSASNPMPPNLWSSSNWSGYSVDTVGNSPAPGVAPQAVTKVTGSWVVPTAASAGRSTTYSSFWVGIDGDNSGTVQQIGTDSDWVGGKAVYYAWWEMAGQPTDQGSTTIRSMTIHPGDTIVATVQALSATQYKLTITDGNQSFTTTQTVGIAVYQASAEWIAERPTLISWTGRESLATLSNFGKVTFTNAQAAINNGPLMSISALAASGNADDILPSGTPTLLANAIDMANTNGKIVAATSVLNSAGNSFTVASSGTTPAAPSGAAKKAGVNDHLSGPGVLTITTVVLQPVAAAQTLAELAPPAPVHQIAIGQVHAEVPPVSAPLAIVHPQASTMPTLVGVILGTDGAPAGTKADSDDGSDNPEPVEPGAWLPGLPGHGSLPGYAAQAQPVMDQGSVGAYFSNEDFQGTYLTSSLSTGPLTAEMGTLPSGTTGAGALLASMLLGAVWAYPVEQPKSAPRETVQATGADAE